MNFERNKKISTKQLFKNEEVFRPILVLTVFFIFILLQKWSLQSLFTIIIIPIITFSEFLFFRINAVLKNFAYIEIQDIKYNPLGNENQISDRLYFCLLLELILVLMIGTEGLYHPQLIDNHFAFYVIPLVLIYLFTNYYSLYDIGFSAKIEISIKNELYEPNKEQNEIKKENLLISYLKTEDFGKMFNHLQFTFGILSLSWLILSILGYFELIPGFSIPIPGSNVIGGTNLSLSYFIFICILIVPIIFISIIKKTNKTISNFEYDKLNGILDGFSEYKKRKIIKILKFYSMKDN